MVAINAVSPNTPSAAPVTTSDNPVINAIVMKTLEQGLVSAIQQDQAAWQRGQDALKHAIDQNS